MYVDQHGEDFDDENDDQQIENQDFMKWFATIHKKEWSAQEKERLQMEEQEDYQKNMLDGMTDDDQGDQMEENGDEEYQSCESEKNSN